MKHVFKIVSLITFVLISKAAFSQDVCEICKVLIEQAKDQTITQSHLNFRQVDSMMYNYSFDELEKASKNTDSHDGISVDVIKVFTLGFSGGGSDSENREKFNSHKENFKANRSEDILSDEYVRRNLFPVDALKSIDNCINNCATSNQYGGLQVIKGSMVGSNFSIRIHMLPSAFSNKNIYKVEAILNNCVLRGNTQNELSEDHDVVYFLHLKDSHKERASVNLVVKGYKAIIPEQIFESSDSPFRLSTDKDQDRNSNGFQAIKFLTFRNWDTRIDKLKWVGYYDRTKKTFWYYALDEKSGNIITPTLHPGDHLPLYLILDDNLPYKCDVVIDYGSGDPHFDIFLGDRWHSSIYSSSKTLKYISWDYKTVRSLSINDLLNQ